VLVESTEFASKQPSVEPEHERCVHNNIRCQPEAFLFMWMEIIYKVYGMSGSKSIEVLKLNNKKAILLGLACLFLINGGCIINGERLAI
jgi:hypothetical protein